MTRLYADENFPRPVIVELRCLGHHIRFRQLVLRAMAEGVISRERAEELCPGIVSIDGKEERMAKAKKIAALPLDERRRLLEAVAERAAHKYETDKELTAFTELDGAVNE